MEGLIYAICMERNLSVREAGFVWRKYVQSTSGITHDVFYVTDPAEEFVSKVETIHYWIDEIKDGY